MLITYFFWLCSMVPSLIFYESHISTVALVFFLISLALWFINIPRVRINWRWILRVAIFPILILIIGTLFRAGDNWQPKQNSEFIVHALSVILVIQILTSIVCIVRTSRGARLLSLSIIVWLFLISVSARFIAGMSITGDWL